MCLTQTLSVGFTELFPAQSSNILLSQTSAGDKQISIALLLLFFFSFLTLLLSLFLLVTILVPLVRNARNKRSSTIEKEEPDIDPWEEAGQRLYVADSGGDLSGRSDE